MIDWVDDNGDDHGSDQGEDNDDGRDGKNNKDDDDDDDDDDNNNNNNNNYVNSIMIKKANVRAWMARNGIGIMAPVDGRNFRHG